MAFFLIRWSQSILAAAPRSEQMQLGDYATVSDRRRHVAAAYHFAIAAIIFGISI
jgi:hypothetical protein